MSKTFAMIGSMVGGWAGWSVGAEVSIFAAYMLGIVGTAAGVYYGVRLARRYG